MTAVGAVGRKDVVEEVQGLVALEVGVVPTHPHHLKLRGLSLGAPWLDMKMLKSLFVCLADAEVRKTEE